VRGEVRGTGVASPNVGDRWRELVGEKKDAGLKTPRYIETLRRGMQERFGEIGNGADNLTAQENFYG
jgi:hypothetical protein